MKNDSINVDNEVVVEKESNASVSPKDEFLSDGKITVWEIILIARYFLPIITTVGFGLSLIFEPKAGDFLDTLTMVFAYVGWISALTVSPIKILSFIWGSIVTCFKTLRGFIPFYGVADLAAGVVGFAVGLSFSLAVLAFIPAVFTIPKYFKN